MQGVVILREQGITVLSVQQLLAARKFDVAAQTAIGWPHIPQQLLVTSSSSIGVLKPTNLAVLLQAYRSQVRPPTPCTMLACLGPCTLQNTSLQCSHHCDSVSGAVACAWVDNGPAPSLLLSGSTESNMGGVILLTFAAGLGCFGDWCHKLSWGPLNVRPALPTQQPAHHQCPQPHQQMLTIGNDRKWSGRHSFWLTQGRVSPF